MAKDYDLDCPVARTLEVIGERWTALILRDLLLNKSRRFQDFLDSLTGITPKALSDRLKSLETGGLVLRQVYADHPPRFEYVLTNTGRSLGPVIKALREWGLHHAS